MVPTFHNGFVLTVAIPTLLLLGGCASLPCETALATPPTAASIRLERVTTIVPFPRGLVLHDGKLYILSRGRVRDAGGVGADIDDQAGTIYVADPEIAEPVDLPQVSDAVRMNGAVLAAPTEPPFHLWNRSADPPESDRETDRPYCTLRYHGPTRSFYMCAFSGIDKPNRPGRSAFSKNLTDAVLRYDLRTRKWYEVERHNIEAGGAYPHHDVGHHAPPHGWLNGPDNCLAVGKWLYAVAKDNNVLVRYDLSSLIANPEAGAPPSELVLGPQIEIAGRGPTTFFGHSALAARDDYLYLAFRTSSAIIRVPLNADGTLVQPITGQLVALFEPYDPATGKSGNITDMDFDSDGFLYVISAKPSRVYRFKPDPADVFDARLADVKPWADLAGMTHNPQMKSENILVDDRNRVFVTSGDGYSFQNNAYGTVYRITPLDR